MLRNFKNQSGMVLVLSILIVSVVLASAAAFSNLIIREIQQSRLIDQSMQAYYLAESGAERALYQSRRKEAVKPDDCGLIISGSSCQESPGQYGYCSGTVGNQLPCITNIKGDLNVRGGWQVAISNEPETTVNLNAGESLQIDLFSPYQGGDFETEVESFEVASTDIPNAALYAELTNLTWLIGGSPTCFLDTLVPPRPAISKGKIELIDNTTGYKTNILPGDPTLDPNCSYALRVGNVLLPEANEREGKYTIRIYGDVSGNDQLDIPSRLIIDSKAIFGKSLQKVRVKTPIRPPLSGLYDFVLFSEEEIVK